MRMEQGNHVEAFVLNPLVDFRDGSLDKDLMKLLKKHWVWVNDERQTGQLKLSQDFYSLFPKSWNVYQTPNKNLTMICEKYSPIIRNNYKESSFPTALFDWSLYNNSDEMITLSIMFTFQSEESRQRHCKSSSTFKRNGTLKNGNLFECITMGTTVSDKFSHHDQIQFCVGASSDSESEITSLEYFNAMNGGHLQEMWNQFERVGSLPKQVSKDTSSKHLNSSAICVKVQIQPNTCKRISFNLNWNMPIVRFGPKMDVRYKKHYTKYFDNVSLTDDQFCFGLCKESFEQSEEWREEIQKWHIDVISQVKSDTSPTIVSALFNELYYIVDGGTIWTNGGELEENQETSSDTLDYFSYLEGHEYLMHNTYDVHFYASHAMIVNWPLIQLSIQRDIARSVGEEISQETTFYLSNMRNKRKVMGAVPHDVGTPYDRPWKLVNAYQFQDVNKWKDLNSQFILSIFRDYVYTRDEEFLKQVYPAVIMALNYSLENFDRDKDGMIENDGFPDSTYDAWKVTGVSAYSGGLWIGALQSVHEMASIMNDEQTVQRMATNLKTALQSYEEKLWDNVNGYYHYDASSLPQSNSIMSDHLHGSLMLLLIDKFLNENGSSSSKSIIPFNMERVKLSSEKILAANVEHFQATTGLGGAMNGMRPNNEIDRTSLQSREVWIGTSYSLAALLIIIGKRNEGIKLMESIFTTGWSEKLGFWFQSPEAITETGEYRALGYMRPLSVWTCFSVLRETQ